MSSSHDDWRASRDYKRKQLERSTAEALRIRCPECGASPHSDCRGIGGPGVHLSRRIDAAASAKGRR